MILEIVGAPYVACNLRRLAIRGRLLLIGILERSRAGEFDLSRTVVRHIGKIMLAVP